MKHNTTDRKIDRKISEIRRSRCANSDFNLPHIKIYFSFITCIFHIKLHAILFSQQIGLDRITRTSKSCNGRKKSKKNSQPYNRFRMDDTKGQHISKSKRKEDKTYRPRMIDINQQLIKRVPNNQQ
jgi:hypothetical protein